MKDSDFENIRADKRCGRIPPLIICPHCQPGTISYAGKVLTVVCAACRAAIAEAGR